ncbi:hypothetical protein [Streptomyces noursei]|uniref:hypothetical protein n=1 Tax=Streptomyces noursei TaxID=1971 RepID=UPI0023B7C17A|nr:hypothetical protein [Streptomyces noursei]
MTETETSARAVAQLADEVHWVLKWPDNPTWRDRLRRWAFPEAYFFDRRAAPPKSWVDRPAGAFERTGWRIRAAYVGCDLAFEVEYVICELCGTGWVESPYTSHDYERCGLATAGLRSLCRAYLGVEWHTAGGHFREAKQFWDSVGANVPGAYTRQEMCGHVEA